MVRDPSIKHNPLPSKINEELKTIVNSMLIKDPFKRPSARDLVQTKYISNRIKSDIIEHSCFGKKAKLWALE